MANEAINLKTEIHAIPVQLANIELNNVEKVWSSFPIDGTRSYYTCPEELVPLTSLVKSHFKGIASYGNKLLFTHTNLELIISNPLTNGVYLIADQILNGQGPSDIDAVYTTLPSGWPHPCSTQACGSFMAMGIQKDESGQGAEKSEIQILDIRMAQVNQPISLITTIPRPRDGVNGVGMTKETGPDGRYVVAGINATCLTVYRSKTSDLLSGDVSFDEVLQTEIKDSGPGLALVTQQGDGALYLFALNADNAGQNNQLNLYRLDLQSKIPSCTLVGKKNMNIPGMSDSVQWIVDHVRLLPPPFDIVLKALLDTLGAPLLNSSFRWGKGLAINSPNTIEVFATDRNAIPLSHIPLIGIGKDFSLVTWSLPYSIFLLHTPTAIYQSDAANFATWCVGEYDGDASALFGVKTQNTDSGMVEVHVLSSNTNYGVFALHTPTAIYQSDAANFATWCVGEYDGDASALFGVKTQNTDSGMVEVHVLKG